MITLAIILVILTVVFFKYGKKYLEYRALFNSLPGETSFSYILGNLHMYPGPNEEGIAWDFKMSQQHKYFHRVWAGAFVPVIIAYHPETIRAIVKSSAPKPRGKFLCTSYDMALRWLGEGLLIANGARWARSRRLLTPAFHFDILKPYMNIYNESATVLLSRIKELSSKGKSFDIFGPISMSALDVILRCAFSYRTDCQTKGNNEYTSALTDLLQLWTDRFFKPYLFIEFVYGLTSEGRRFYKLCDVVHAVSEGIIEKRMRELENEDEKLRVLSKKEKDFLDILLTARDEDGDGLSPLEIRNEVDTFLFEGHDTTTSGMSWTLYRLAQHPQYQEMVYDEVIGVLGDREEVEWEDLPQLEFTTMCIKEALRLDPTVPLIERRLAQDVEMAGHRIPADTLVTIHISILHHNPHLWDQPNEFVPERFHPDKQRHMDPFQFIPFSAGSRNCIGQNFAMNEMKVTVAQVIKNFKLSIDPSQPARRITHATMKAEKGAMIFATPRDKQM